MIRIVRTPFVYPDGQIQIEQEVISKPQGVEVDGQWVHVVTYDTLGNRHVNTSYPSHEVQLIDWNYEGGEETP